MKRFILTVTAVFFTFALVFVLIGFHVFEKPTAKPTYAPTVKERLLPKKFFHFAP